MIRHIVLWQLKPELNKEETYIKWKAMFGAFAQQVPGLKNLGVYKSFAGWDLCLVSEHENKEALEAYQEHPEHIKAVTVVRSGIVDRAFCDFEIE